METTTPKIALVGPTNVGKSTLFNRLTRTRAAIVCDRPGVTIDRHELTVAQTPAGPVSLVDTGGVGPSLEKHPLGPAIARAAAEAIETADLVLFIADATREASIEEFEVASWLRRQADIDGKEVWVLANKADSGRFDSSSYHCLGFSRLLEISAEHGTGIEELWQEIDIYLRARRGEPVEIAPVAKEDASPRVMVLGRPNVGKSTLLNSVLGYERHVTSEMPGTTRDVVESDYEAKGLRWKLLDTAGMRRPGRLEAEVERVTRYKLEDAARSADLAILVVDSSEGVTDLDAALGGLALDFGLSVVVAFNKWDKMRDAEKNRDAILKLERTKDLKLDFLEWCPQVQVSGLTGRGVPELLKAINRVLEGREQRVQTSKLNTLFERKLKYHSHPMGKSNRPAKFYYLSQVDTAPPEFVLFSNLQPSDIHFSYKRFMSNSLRKSFGFLGTPIRLRFRQAHKSWDEVRNRNA